MNDLVRAWFWMRTPIYAPRWFFALLIAMNLTTAFLLGLHQ